MGISIPISFEAHILNESVFNESLPNVRELLVGVFTKGRNRNGSFITEEIAQNLIDSAVRHHVPLVGFFDKEEKEWVGHTGPEVANAYGYVDKFVGWKTFTDSDSIEREYATFSVILFSDYFIETKYILESNQSMELAQDSVEGTVSIIDGEPTFVYSKADICALCVIGQREPCFSASHFFKEENFYNKFSLSLNELQKQISTLSGEISMDSNVISNAITADVPLLSNDAINYTVEDNNIIIGTSIQTEDSTTFEEQPAAEPQAEPTVDFEQEYNNLQESYSMLKAEFDAMKQEFEQIKADYETCKQTNDEYAKKIRKCELKEKEELISTYQKLLNEEDIEEVRENIEQFSYSDIESKLALKYSRNAMKEQTNFVPVVNPEEEDFSFMKKYKKH